MKKKWMLYGLAVVMAVAIACGGETKTPVSPTSTSGSSSEAAADGSTLKATAPPLVSPANGVRIDNRTPQLIATKSTGVYEPSATFTYRMEMRDSADVLIDSTSGPAAADGRIVWTTTKTLDTDKTYKWRARAEMGTAVGPWSAYFTFITPNTPNAIPSYQTATTLWDNLEDGRTIGRPTNMEFKIATSTTRGGARTISTLSFIQYPMQQTLTEGEMSFYVDNFNPLAAGAKTKFASQSSDAADVTTDPWRFTLEKRGVDCCVTPGQVRWRIIVGNPLHESGKVFDSPSWQPNLDKTKTHFIKYTWGNGRVTLKMNQADPNTGVLGTTVLDVSSGYSGTYRPTPHMIYVGVEPGRAGESDASVPNMTVRWVWISDGRTPRPTMTAADLATAGGPGF